LTGGDMDTKAWNEVFYDLNVEVDTWRDLNRKRNSPKDNYVEQLKITNSATLEVSGYGV
jgi:hypothetical protein